MNGKPLNRHCENCGKLLNYKENHVRRVQCFSCQPYNTHIKAHVKPVCSACGNELTRDEVLCRRKKCFACLPKVSYDSAMTLVYDPCPYPLITGMTISAEEVRNMLRFESFALGTKLRDAKGHVLVVGSCGLVAG
jgi:hypothetical protein